MTAYVAADHPVILLLAVAVAGLSVGVGLVVGVAVARAVRRYLDNTTGDPNP